MALVTSITSRRGGRHAAGAVFALAASLLAAACATPMSQRDLEVRLRSAGASVRGLGSNFVVFPIHADSKVAAWTLLAESKSDDSSLLSKRLSHDFARGAKRRGAVVVGGLYPALTRQIVLNALALNEERGLPGLTLAYVGGGEHAREMRLAARAHGARFYHRELR